MLKKIRFFLLALNCSLIASCTLGHVHQQHIVDNIDQRAVIISKQTRYLSPQIVILALIAYNNAQRMGYGEKHMITIIDYSQPSSHNRFWVVDLDKNRVLFREPVAHGVGSGELFATNFSNGLNSKATSIGVYVTAPQVYIGRHGYALRLKGLEPGFNDNAWTRAIVIHGAAYACEAYIKEHGSAGQSWGCPALPMQSVKKVINTIQGGTLVLAYAKDPLWLNHSKLLQ